MLFERKHEKHLFVVFSENWITCRKLVVLFAVLGCLTGGCRSDSDAITGVAGAAGSEAVSAALPGQPVRGTEAGAVAGVDLGQTFAWFGIPYAKPPVGALRWRAPEDVEPWTGTFDATTFGQPATQIAGIMGSIDSATYGALMGSEDCLTLNVWQPRGAENLPVLVLVHGGGDYAGHAGMPGFDGANFAAANRIVVVSVNYRLGLLGWFTHPALRAGADELDASGNYGTLDLVKSLEWVRDNIAAFGGDPARVTLLGEGAGGANVFALLAAPLAEGLFCKAVVQSGFPASTEPAEGDSLAGDLLLELLVSGGLAADRPAAQDLLESKEDEWIADYLRSRSAGELYAAYAASHGMTGQLGGILKGFHAIFNDGSVIPQKGVAKAILDGDYARMPLLVGFNSDDGLVPLPMADATRPGDKRPADAAFMDIVAGYDPQSPDADLVGLRPLLGLLARSDLDPNESLPQTMTSAALLIGISKQQDELYSYTFDWQSEPWPFNLLIGAASGMEMPFVLGNFSSAAADPLRFAWSEKNRAGRERLAAAMMAYWGEFIRKGDPNLNGLPLWKPYNHNTGGRRRVILNESFAEDAGENPTPPWQAETGYGSTARYICDRYESYEFGSGTNGTRVWYYVPAKLKNGDSAPVVVFLHGFFVICPPLYMGEIEHYVKQGYIVIFPQYNYGWLGLMVDLDQEKMLKRAIAGTDECLARLGDMADATDVTLAGHSLGGMQVLCWIADGGIQPKVIISQNACVFPKILTDLVSLVFTAQDWQAKAQAIDVPIIFLACQEDYMAQLSGIKQAYAACVNAPSKVLYYVPSDYYGEPGLQAGHASGLQDSRPIPPVLVNLLLENGEENALDFRVFYAATDAAMDGLTRVPFDMGTWSDGRPVKAPRVVLENP